MLLIIVNNYLECTCSAVYFYGKASEPKGVQCSWDVGGFCIMFYNKLSLEAVSFL